MSRYTFRFIGGKYEGGTIALPATGTIGIGRAQEREICLVEDMVSRHHAQIEVREDRVILTDMKSTNGTFVNNERVDMCELENGDRILVGTSILRLVDTTVEQIQLSAGAQENAQTAVTQAPTIMQEAMNGDLADVALSDLLQLLGGNLRTGRLSISTPAGIASITLASGVGHTVAATQYPTLSGIKVLCRLLRLTSGEFSFLDEPVDAATADANLGRIEAALMEAARQNDEANRLLKELGQNKTSVHLRQPMGGRLAQLEPQALDVVQLVHERGGPIDSLLDASIEPDHILLEHIIALGRGGFLLYS